MPGIRCVVSPAARPRLEESHEANVRNEQNIPRGQQEVEKFRALESYVGLTTFYYTISEEKRHRRQEDEPGTKLQSQVILSKASLDRPNVEYW